MYKHLIQIIQNKKRTMTKQILAIIAVGGMFALTSCGDNQGNTAETTEAQEVQEVAAEATMLSVDPMSSEITWIGSKPTGKHNGTISVTGGDVALQGTEVTGGNFVIDITSLTVLDMPEGSQSHGKLRGHLMSDDFFSAEEFPTAEFTITSLSPYDQTQLVVNDEFETENTPLEADEHIIDNPTHMVSGNLTMRGTTKNVTFPARVQVIDGQVAAAAKFNINRTDWGLQYNNEANVADKLKDGFIYNTVNVGFELVAR